MKILLAFLFAAVLGFDASRSHPGDMWKLQTKSGVPFTKGGSGLNRPLDVRLRAILLAHCSQAQQVNWCYPESAKGRLIVDNFRAAPGK